MTGPEIAIAAAKIAAIVALVLLNGFFVAAEFGLVKLRDSQLRSLESRGSRRAAYARKILENLDASLSACQLGITLASLSLGWIGKPIFVDLLAPIMNTLEIHNASVQHSIAFIFGFTTITFLHITAGEQVPKMLAITHPLKTSLWIAHPLILFHKISYPFIWLLNSVSAWMLKKIGIDSSDGHGTAHTEKELRLMLSTAHQTKGGSALGRQIILNAIDLRQRLIREVMKPRNEIVFLDLAKSLKDNFALAFEEEYSRYPLCRDGELDQAVGLVHFRDLCRLEPSAEPSTKLEEIAHDLIFVPETARLEHLLEHFLKQKLHFGLVVDEYGSTVGMVTLENILEELVGQIQDEFDEEEPLVKQTSPNSWELNGSTPLHDLSDIIGIPLQEEGINTTSGWLTVQIGEFPKIGDQIDIDGFKIRITKLDGIKVDKLILQKIRPAKTDDPPAPERSQPKIV
ncbi:MAG: Magnesium and cobalt efflux protein CorC [Verrucomicrobia subdivision 3 bacterium]|nr:Magnesium and cobalt efflux protein CorC [Limisphaerales bacterium]MCS1416454.1 Magnesium and cobalt efflux protein CorC [Limisphaerales bacterium]